MLGIGHFVLCRMKGPSSGTKYVNNVIQMCIRYDLLLFYYLGIRIYVLLMDRFIIYIYKVRHEYMPFVLIELSVVVVCS